MRTGHRTRRLGSLFAVLLCSADALSAPGDKPSTRSDPMSVEELQRKLRSAEVDERRLAAAVRPNEISGQELLAGPVISLRVVQLVQIVKLVQLEYSLEYSVVRLHWL